MSLNSILLGNVYKDVSNSLFAMLYQAQTSLNRKITWLSAATISIILFVIGLFLIWANGEDTWLSVTHPAISFFLKEMGGIIAASGLVAIIWEISIKRTFFNEVMEKVGLASDVDKAGLTGVTMRFYQDIDWAALLKNTKKLDIFFTYGSTWRHINTVQLSELANHGVSIRVVLPDADDEALMIQLGNRYGYDKDEMKRRIVGAKTDLHEKFNGSPSDFKLYRTKTAPLFDIYKFDDVAVITMFKHRRDRVPVPAFQLKRGGELYDFADSEIKAFFDDPNPLASPEP